MFMVAPDALPDDPRARARLLARRFQRWIARSRRCERGWAIELEAPDYPGFYVDPEIEDGMRWWGGGDPLPLNLAPLAVRQDEGFLLAMNDNWTLFSWSCWLKDRLAAGQRPARLNVIHLDSHSDMMSPRLSRRGEAWTDLHTGEPVDLWRPETVVAAIGSGAIGIGSFIAPLFHEIPATNVFHLCCARHFRRPPGAYAMTPAWGDEDALFNEARRPEFELAPIDGEDRRQGVYFLTDDLDALLSRVPPAPTLLHLDMDYFNNRFDGNPDWADIKDRHDPERGTVLNEIDGFFQALAASATGEWIEDVSVGLSPAFFPAALWPPAIDGVRRGVRTLASLTTGASS